LIRALRFAILRLKKRKLFEARHIALSTAFLPVAPETFRYWKARSQEHLHRLHDRIAEIQRIREEFGYCAIPDDDDPYPPYRPALLRLSKHPHAEGA
jgi:hypothetical protein